jgi:hypothetical protein
MSGINQGSWKVGHGFSKGIFFSVVDYNGLSSPDEMAYDLESFLVRMFQLPLFCMDREIGISLGSTVGEVEEVDTNGEGIG